MHPQNKKLISLTLIIFHLDRSGIDINEGHLTKAYSILVNLSVFHLDISGKVFNP